MAADNVLWFWLVAIFYKITFDSFEWFGGDYFFSITCVLLIFSLNIYDSVFRRIFLQ